jgi:hypothetical protein
VVVGGSDLRLPEHERQLPPATTPGNVDIREDLQMRRPFAITTLGLKLLVSPTANAAPAHDICADLGPTLPVGVSSFSAAAWLVSDPPIAAANAASLSRHQSTSSREYTCLDPVFHALPGPADRGF